MIRVSPSDTPIDASPCDFNPEIRHFVDDPRSALEFCAFDAHERFCNHSPSSDERVHRQVNSPVTPMGKAEADFLDILEAEQLGDLKSANLRMVDVFRAAKAYVSVAGPSLPNLHTRWNDGKHRNLIYFSRMQDFVTIDPSQPEQNHAYQFVSGISFSVTRDRVEAFLALAHGQAARVVEAADRALCR